jgi:hypothetical protein
MRKLDTRKIKQMEESRSANTAAKEAFKSGSFARPNPLVLGEINPAPSKPAKWKPTVKRKRSHHDLNIG